MIVGIDPGVTGAAAALYPSKDDDPAFISEVIDLPTHREGKRNRINALRLSEWIVEMHPSRIVIEAVGPMPRDGRVAAFRFGMAVGTIHTVCLMLGYNPELVTPQVWKGYFDLPAHKEAALRLARQLFPTSRPQLVRAKDHNRAEAMLIARWADRPLIGKDW